MDKCHGIEVFTDLIVRWSDRDVNEKQKKMCAHSDKRMHSKICLLINTVGESQLQLMHRLTIIHTYLRNCVEKIRIIIFSLSSFGWKYKWQDSDNDDDDHRFRVYTTHHPSSYIVWLLYLLVARCVPWTYHIMLTARVRSIATEKEKEKKTAKSKRQSQFQWKQVGSRLPFRQRWLSRRRFSCEC